MIGVRIFSNLDSFDCQNCFREESYRSLSLLQYPLTDFAVRLGALRPEYSFTYKVPFEISLYPSHTSLKILINFNNSSVPMRHLHCRIDTVHLLV